MPKQRQIRTCSRCRVLKLRCDRTKPCCQRCSEVNVSCSLGTFNSALPPISRTETTGHIPTAVEMGYRPPPNLAYDKGHGRMSAGEETGITKKRQRAHLSCVRCHRLKVKCDRELPCSRCHASGWDRDCSYSHSVNNETTSSETHSQKIGEHPDHFIPSWHAQRRGPTLWKQVLSSVSLHL